MPAWWGLNARRKPIVVIARDPEHARTLLGIEPFHFAMHFMTIVKLPTPAFDKVTESGIYSEDAHPQTGLVCPSCKRVQAYWASTMGPVRCLCGAYTGLPSGNA